MANRLPEDQRKAEAILVSMTRGTRRRVEELASQEKVSMAEVTRRALDRYLEELETQVNEEVPA